MRRDYILLASCLLICLNILSCGGEASKSEQTSIEVLPESPIVITADIKDPSITAPWFRFQVKVTNTSDQPLTIVSLEVKVQAYINGTNQEKTSATDPSEFNVDGATPQDSCEYSSFGVIQPGETSFLVPTLYGDPTNPPTCGIDRLTFYSQSNPKDPSSNTGTPPRYRVTVRPIGWFGTEDNPTDRYTKTFQFSTQ